MLPGRRAPRVPMKAAGLRADCMRPLIRCAVVLLPLVPVTAKSWSFRCGFPANTQAARAIDERGFLTVIHGRSTVFRAGRSVKIAAAPAATASFR